MEASAQRREIGARISEALTRTGLSQRQLARQMGKGSSTITGWVNGKTQPSLEELAEICDLTGARADWILGLGGKAPAPQVDVKAVRRVMKKLSGVAEALESLDALLGEADDE